MKWAHILAYSWVTPSPLDVLHVGLEGTPLEVPGNRGTHWKGMGAVRGHKENQRPHVTCSYGGWIWDSSPLPRGLICT